MYVLLLKRQIALDEWDESVFLFTPGGEQSDKDVEKMVEAWVVKYERDHGASGTNTLGFRHSWLDLGIVQPEW